MKSIIPIFLCVQVSSSVFLAGAEAPHFEYRVLATSKTSTMEKELNEAADAGYALSGVMGGQSAFGGKEVVVVMGKSRSGDSQGRRYKLLATSKTSTLEKELQEAGDEGFEYRGQTIFESAFGGKEVSVILEQPKGPGKRRHIMYRCLQLRKRQRCRKNCRRQAMMDSNFLAW